MTNDTQQSRELKTGRSGDSIASVPSSSCVSISANDQKYVFVGANRDVLAEIGYYEDKARLDDNLRAIDWDPTFWSLSDEIVGVFNGDDATIREKISELNQSISEKEAFMVKMRKHLRLKNKERGVVNPAIDAFPYLVEPPNRDEPFNDLSELARTTCDLLRKLESVNIRNLEIQMKLASMEGKLNRLREDLQGFKNRDQNLNLNAHLLAIEMQNSMLNELLNSIIERIKQTTQDVENFKSEDTKVLVKIIKDATDVNLGVIGDCYPHIEYQPGVNQLLWLPHDVKHMGFEEYLKTLTPKDYSLDVKLDWKQRKKNMKEVSETRNHLMTLKRKIKWIDRRRSYGLLGTIEYLTEEQVKALGNTSPFNSINYQ